MHRDGKQLSEVGRITNILLPSEAHVGLYRGQRGWGSSAGVGWRHGQRVSQPARPPCAVGARSSLPGEPGHVWQADNTHHPRPEERPDTTSSRADGESSCGQGLCCCVVGDLGAGPHGGRAASVRCLESAGSWGSRMVPLDILCQQNGQLVQSAMCPSGAHTVPFFSFFFFFLFPPWALGKFPGI